MTTPHQPRVLVIAGSDSSGGAGIEADRNTLAAHGIYAQNCITALTAQNTLGVHDIHSVPAGFVGKAIDACLDDIGTDVVKIGMLGNESIVRTVSQKLRQWDCQKVVLDPVMVSTSGHRLLEEGAIEAVCELLVPGVELITPNIPEGVLLVQEAEKLAARRSGGRPVPETPKTPKHPETVEDLETLARRIYELLGAKNVLLKGGHLPLTSSPSDPTTLIKADLSSFSSASKSSPPTSEISLVDILYSGHTPTIIKSPYTPSKNTHGTGCSLASAIAANLALSLPLEHSVRKAISYVATGIQTSTSIGRGSGPINHFHNIHVLPFSRGGFLSYVLERADVKPVWEKFVDHAFATAMGNGTMDQEVFKRYLVQDYLYLTHFARTNALAGYKCSSMEQIAASAEIIGHIQTEMQMHLEYCETVFGLSRQEIEHAKESLACTAYSRYVLDVGMQGDLLGLRVALASCLVGYQVVAQRLDREFAGHGDASGIGNGKGKAGNKYWRWVENYISPDYAAAVRKGMHAIEVEVWKVGPQRIEELVKVFVRCTELECAFWEDGTGYE